MPSTCASVKVNFSPIVCPSQTTNQQMCPQREFAGLPTFNMDKNFFTPAFILEIEKVKTFSILRKSISKMAPSTALFLRKGPLKWINKKNKW